MPERINLEAKWNKEVVLSMKMSQKTTISYAKCPKKATISYTKCPKKANLSYIKCPEKTSISYTKCHKKATIIYICLLTTTNQQRCRACVPMPCSKQVPRNVYNGDYT